METRTRFLLFEKHKLSMLNLPNRTNFMSGVKKVWFHSVWIMKHPKYKNEMLYADVPDLPETVAQLKVKLRELDVKGPLDLYVLAVHMSRLTHRKAFYGA